MSTQKPKGDSHERHDRHTRLTVGPMGNSGSNHERTVTHPKGEAMQNLNRKTGRKGQGLVEYILLVFMMGLGCLAALHSLRSSTQTGINSAASNLSTELQTH